MPHLWKTEYAVTINGEDDSWHDDHVDALKAARDRSAEQPVDDVAVVKLEHYLTERTELETFIGGVEAQEEED